jgi:hypothetical protein
MIILLGFYISETTIQSNRTAAARLALVPLAAELLLLLGLPAHINNQFCQPSARRCVLNVALVTQNFRQRHGDFSQGWPELCDFAQRFD